MIAPAARGWNPLAGLSPAALRPVQNEALTVPPAPGGDAELIGSCERYVALHTEWLQLCDEWSALDPNTPAEVALGARMSDVEGWAAEVGAGLVCRTATTQAGLLALARATLHAMVTDPRKGVLDLEPGPDNLPICRRPDDDGVLALVLVSSVLEILGGERMRFVNVPAAPPAPDRDVEPARLRGRFCDEAYWGRVVSTLTEPIGT